MCPALRFLVARVDLGDTMSLGDLATQAGGGIARANVLESVDQYVSLPCVGFSWILDLVGVRLWLVWDLSVASRP